MRRAQVYRWQIPMDAGVVLRERRLKTRDGFFMHLRQGEREGWGEIAPLPGFSLETLDEAQAALMAWTHEWREGEDPALQDVPSVAFGISCALAELDGSLPEAANYRAAPLCTGDPDELFALLSAMPGEKVAKIKVGLYEAVRDGMVVNLLLEAIPDLHLRLDANRAWTPLRAQQFAKYVNPTYRNRIAFLEEPCKTRDDSRAFARETGIAIAWDESLREADFAFAAEPGVRAVVIKPTLTGSLDKVREQVAAAHAAGLTAVISSSIESSLGLTQLARIAAWLTPDTVPGLDTLNLMQAQLIRQWPGSTLPCLDVGALEPLR
ncbi:o-succinylbenzoate synthase [Enterobacter cloacae complex sp. IR53043]|uniref:o-succinylbenzoate synthase n=1 Tax=Enterobacter cloacae complex TaxID=354276 RepID=UPI0007359CF2|nr:MULTISPECIES: o-succinylbenzoate synthase [Enterobacter cloacae complex]AXQ33575.1 o-succinylbenzoate synthase [Enterobacter hormaechei]EHN8935748.1 o-succinylbenzoate synthase [Enterobacter hormaechei]EKS6504671.1 o-succinylbenzoate synthase [Enterobacter hormaechei]EKX4734396.1 o-succinylbenzoate synthase [Enterobacter hormaechei]ELC6426479.1 o-succinylbenzoate synthase [Enterobacter hormaechei]